MLAAPLLPLILGASPLDAYPDAVQRALDAWHVPGAAVAVVRGPDVLLLRGVGVREAGKPAAVDASTVFAIASLTKGFTAALLAQAVERNAIAWDDPVTKHLPTFRVEDPSLSQALTVRDLASHRTGLSEVSDALWYESGRSKAQVLEALRYLPATQPLRTGYAYLNVSYLVLGELLERTGGTPWAAQVQRALLDPAAMSSTFTDARRCRAAKNRATPHSDDGDRPTPMALEDADNIAPAAALCSTAADLARWMQVLLGKAPKPVLSEAARAELFTPANLIPVGPYARSVYPGLRTQAYGAGWVLQHHQGRFLAWNTGGLDGVTATIVLVPDEALGVAVLTNGPRTSLPEALAFQGVDLLLGAPPRDWSADRLAISLAGRERQAKALAARQAARIKDTHPALNLSAYAGTWKQPLLGELRLELDGTQLRARLGAWRGTLEHYHYDTFEILWEHKPLGRTLATFNLDAGGKPATLELEDYGRFTR